jgi:DNA-directed RNA polymerase alpha subunit
MDESFSLALHSLSDRAYALASEVDAIKRMAFAKEIPGYGKRDREARKIIPFPVKNRPETPMYTPQPHRELDEELRTMGFSQSVLNIFYDQDISTVAELTSLTPTDVYRCRKCGVKKLAEIQAVLKSRGLRLNEEKKLTMEEQA